MPHGGQSNVQRTAPQGGGYIPQRAGTIGPQQQGSGGYATMPAQMDMGPPSNVRPGVTTQQGAGAVVPPQDTGGMTPPPQTQPGSIWMHSPKPVQRTPGMPNDSRSLPMPPVNFQPPVISPGGGQPGQPGGQPGQPPGMGGAMNPFAWQNPYQSPWFNAGNYNPSMPSYGLLPGLRNPTSIPPQMSGIGYPMLPPPLTVPNVNIGSPNGGSGGGGAGGSGY